MKAKDCAKLIRKELKAALPSYRFSVTTDGVINPMLDIFITKMPADIENLPEEKRHKARWAILPCVKQIVEKYRIDKSDLSTDYHDCNFIPSYSFH